MSNNCLQCGREKKDRTKLCYYCRKSDPVRASRVCPECGGSKHIGAEMCWNCHATTSTSETTKHVKVPCPKCGKPMLRSSSVCISCAWGGERKFLREIDKNKSRAARPNWELVTDEFLYQFVGLFLGEGSVGFHRDKSCDTALSVRLSIGLRCDDIHTLWLIQERFGGSIYIDRYKRSNPVARWQVHSIADVDHILRLIRPIITLPMRKVQEIDLAIEFLDYRVARNIRQLSAETVTSFFDRMQALRIFAMPDL